MVANVLMITFDCDRMKTVGGEAGILKFPTRTMIYVLTKNQSAVKFLIFRQIVKNVIACIPP